MYELREDEFYIAKPFADSFLEDPVFINSVLCGSRFGRIFTDNATSPSAALYWHRCGFAYICGEPDKAFLEAVIPFLYERFETEKRRFRLHIYDKRLNDYFCCLSGLKVWKQYVFSIKSDSLFPFYRKLPNGYSLKEADIDDLSGFTGKIVPTFSWATNADFLREGKGFCVMYENKVAAMAFTCAIGGNTVDIGIETAEAHRGRGLGKIAASKLADYLLNQGFFPVWRCADSNPASRGIAEAVGFVLESEHNVYMKMQNT